MSAQNINPSLSLIDIGRGRVQVKIECDKDMAPNIVSLVMQNSTEGKSISKTKTKGKEIPINLDSGARGSGWLRAQIIEEIESFCRENKISTTDLGLRALKDGSFFGRLKKGDRSPTIDRVERLYDFMKSHR
jgi:hypothetical protein